MVEGDAHERRPGGARIRDFNHARTHGEWNVEDSETQTVTFQGVENPGQRHNADQMRCASIFEHHRL